jgi:hypothetical protein
MGTVMEIRSLQNMGMWLVRASVVLLLVMTTSSCISSHSSSFDAYQKEQDAAYEAYLEKQHVEMVERRIQSLEEQLEEIYWGHLKFSDQHPEYSTRINRRRQLADDELPKCQPPEPPSRSLSFEEYLTRFGSFSDGFLAVQLTGALLDAAAAKVTESMELHPEDILRARMNAQQFLRPEHMSFLVFHSIKKTKLTLEGDEPELWSESHGQGRLIWVSANVVSGIQPGGQPMLLTFRRRVCAGDTSFNLRIAFNTDSENMSSFVFPGRDSVLAMFNGVSEKTLPPTKRPAPPVVQAPPPPVWAQPQWGPAPLWIPPTPPPVVVLPSKVWTPPSDVQASPQPNPVTSPVAQPSPPPKSQPVNTESNDKPKKRGWLTFGNMISAGQLAVSIIGLFL